MQVAKIDGVPFSSDEFVSWLKLTGRFPHVVQDMIREKLTAAAAKRRGMEVSIDELQSAADNHRRAHGLQRVAQTTEFLEAASVSLEGYESFIEDTVLADKLRDEIASEASVQEHFNLNKPQYDAIEIGHILVADEDIAREICATVQEDPESFAELAREASIAESAADGGRIGRIVRNALPADLEAKLFAGKAGDLLGPYTTDDGCFEIFKVFAKHDAVLDAPTNDMIRLQLYDRWLRTAVNDFSVEA